MNNTAESTGSFYAVKWWVPEPIAKHLIWHFDHLRVQIMHCTHCKKQAAQNANFCGFCGNKINLATSHGLLNSARFSRGFEQSPSILERTEVAPISSRNDNDRIFFVLGLTIYRDQRLIDWLVQHYPNARIVQFSNSRSLSNQVLQGTPHKWNSGQL